MVKKKRAASDQKQFQNGVTPTELARRYPRLYHMAEVDSWPSIQRHGLLSTTALLTLFDLKGAARDRIESAHRPTSVPINHERYGQAVVRDQIPMRDADLRRCLRDGLTPAEWYRILNGKVFFWVTEERLETLLSARAYRDRTHTVLVLETQTLVEDHLEHVLLSPMNSGCTIPFARPRGRETFRALSDYPFEARRRGAGINAVVELAVEQGVYNVEKYAIEVREQKAGRKGRVIWRRG